MTDTPPRDTSAPEMPEMAPNTFERCRAFWENVGVRLDILLGDGIEPVEARDRAIDAAIEEALFQSFRDGVLAERARAVSKPLPQLGDKWDYAGDDPVWTVLYRWAKAGDPDVMKLFLRPDGGTLRRLAAALEEMRLAAIAAAEKSARTVSEPSASALERAKSLRVYKHLSGTAHIVPFQFSSDELEVIAAAIPAAETATREAAIRRCSDMEAALQEAAVQIEYLHDKFNKTDSGEAVLARIHTILSFDDKPGETP